MEKTALRVSRKITDPELHSSWTLWAVDQNTNKYPQEPSQIGMSEADFDREYHNWQHRCLEIAGLDWSYHYSGPGMVFTRMPVIHVGISRILFRQDCGFDI